MRKRALAADPPGQTLPAVRPFHPAELNRDPPIRRKRVRRVHASVVDKTREELVILHEAPSEDTHRYTILGSIHRGGMGEILLGKIEGHDGFSRKVVLKGLLSKLSEDDVSYQLFMREARLMSNLDHPNIVRVFDLPIIGGKPYLAMEYMRGRNFHQVIQRAAQTEDRGVPAKIALYVVAQALRGLHYAHSMRDAHGKLLGIVHRDVSPGNLLVSFFGEVKVTDFGIAKVAGAPQFTSPRSIRGKARYVAPEQVHGAQATVLSDIYSAGVVLAEALIGEPLWERNSVPETLLAIVTEDRERTIDRILLNHSNIRGLRAALRGALALNPRDRFATALQFAEVLEAVAKAMKEPMDQVQLGLYLRELFTDSLDVPKDDGFGLSGFPIPKFTMDDDDTEPTVVELEEAWIKNKGVQSTTNMRPIAPREPMDPGPTPGLEDPFEPKVEPITPKRPPPPLPPRGASAIRAEPLPVHKAVLIDPAEVPREAARNFVNEVVRDRQRTAKTPVRRPKVEEKSQELTPFPPKRRLRVPPLRPKTNGPHLSPGATGMLLVGIFVGASLAIAGCLIALTFGH